MGTSLAIFSILLSAILYPLALIISLFKAFWKRKFIGAFKNFDNQMLSIATSIDASGNVVCVDLFNITLINKNGYKFGNRKETISSALGKNQRDGTLTDSRDMRMTGYGGLIAVPVFIGLVSVGLPVWSILLIGLILLGLSFMMNKRR